MDGAPSLELSFRDMLMATTAGLRAKREKLLAELRAIDAAIAANERVQLLDGGGDSSSASPELATAHEPRGGMPVRETSIASSWREYILTQLTGINGGKTIREMIEATAGTPLAQKHALSPNSFYASLAKLEKSQKVIRKGKVAYLPDVLAQIEAGEIQEDPPRDHEIEAGGMAVPVARLLANYPDGLKAGEILKALRSDPDAKDRVERNPQIVYGTLGRMAQAKTVERDWRGFYRLVQSLIDASADKAAPANVTPIRGPSHA